MTLEDVNLLSQQGKLLERFLVMFTAHAVVYQVPNGAERGHTLQLGKATNKESVCP